jgi:hypothetical protein
MIERPINHYGQSSNRCYPQARRCPQCLAINIALVPRLEISSVAGGRLFTLYMILIDSHGDREKYFISRLQNLWIIMD